MTIGTGLAEQGNTPLEQQTQIDPQKAIRVERFAEQAVDAKWAEERGVFLQAILQDPTAKQSLEKIDELDQQITTCQQSIADAQEQVLAIPVLNIPEIVTRHFCASLRTGGISEYIASRIQNTKPQPAAMPSIADIDVRSEITRVTFELEHQISQEIQAARLSLTMVEFKDIKAQADKYQAALQSASTKLNEFREIAAYGDEVQTLLNELEETYPEEYKLYNILLEGISELENKRLSKEERSSLVENIRRTEASLNKDLHTDKFPDPPQLAAQSLVRNLTSKAVEVMEASEESTRAEAAFLESCSQAAQIRPLVQSVAQIEDKDLAIDFKADNADKLWSLAQWQKFLTTAQDLNRQINQFEKTPRPLPVEAISTELTTAQQKQKEILERNRTITTYIVERTAEIGQLKKGLEEEMVILNRRMAELDNQVWGSLNQALGQRLRTQQEVTAKALYEQQLAGLQKRNRELEADQALWKGQAEKSDALAQELKLDNDVLRLSQLIGNHKIATTLPLGSLLERREQMIKTIADFLIRSMSSPEYSPDAASKITLFAEMPLDLTIEVIKKTLEPKTQGADPEVLWSREKNLNFKSITNQSLLHELQKEAENTSTGDRNSEYPIAFGLRAGYQARKRQISQ